VGGVAGEGQAVMARYEWLVAQPTGVPPRPAPPPCPWPGVADVDAALRMVAIHRIVGRWKR
jgi:hypothetical protein